MNNDVILIPSKQEEDELLHLKQNFWFLLSSWIFPKINKNCYSLVEQYSCYNSKIFNAHMNDELTKIKWIMSIGDVYSIYQDIYWWCYQPQRLFF